MTEATWRNEGYIPTLEEHQSITFMSCGYKMLTIASFVGMGDIITDDSFKWVLTNPPLIKASSEICRIMDDVVGHKVHTTLILNLLYHYETKILLLWRNDI